MYLVRPELPRVRVAVFLNGTDEWGKAVLVPTANREWPSFLQLIASKFDLKEGGEEKEKRKGEEEGQSEAATYPFVLFTQQGKEVASFQDIKSKQKLYIAQRGEAFKTPGSVSTNRRQSAVTSSSISAALAIEANSDDEDDDKPELPIEVYENCWQQQCLELEALRAYFVNDLKETSALPPRYIIRIVPELPEGSKMLLHMHGYQLSLSLVIMYPMEYPNVPPVIDVRWDGLKEGLSDLKYALLQSLLQQEAKEAVGSPMVLQLAESARRWLQEVGNKKVFKLEKNVKKMKELKKKRKGVMGEARENLRNEQLKQSLESKKNKSFSSDNSENDAVMKQLFHWDYQTLTFEDVLLSQNEKLKRVEKIFNEELERMHSSGIECPAMVPTSVLRVMLHHYKWDDVALTDRFYGLIGRKLKKHSAVTTTSNVPESKQARKRRKKREKQREEAARAAEAAGLDRKTFLKKGEEEKEEGDPKSEERGVDKLFAEVGIPMVKEEPNDHKTLYDKLNHKECCNICMDERRTEKMTSLSCGHWFCNKCYKDYLEVQIKEGTADAIRCPYHKCPMIVDDVIVTSLIARDVFRKYSSFAVKEYVEKSASLAWCTGDKCENIIQLNTNDKSSKQPISDVMCSGCGHMWCFQCKEQSHFPATCDVTRWFVKNYGKIERSDNDKQTMAWIAMYTKDCPACHTPIQKNGGCNHIGCRSCNYQFCWVCLQKWTGSHYSCAKNVTTPMTTREARYEAYMSLATKLSFLQWHSLQNKELKAFHKFRAAKRYKISKYLQNHSTDVKGSRTLRNAVEHVYTARLLMANSAMHGEYLNHNKEPGQKQLKARVCQLNAFTDILIDLMDMPVKDYNVQLIEHAAAVVRDSIMHLVKEVQCRKKEEGEEEIKEAFIIVRKMGQNRGGRRLTRPSTMEELLSAGGKLLNIEAVKARDESGRPLEPDTIPFLPTDTVIHLHTHADELEYL